jgi:hypothetical protein
LVPVLVAVTVTLGTTAPVASVTVPVNAAVLPVCAIKDGVQPTNIKPANTKPANAQTAVNLKNFISIPSFAD